MSICNINNKIIMFRLCFKGGGGLDQIVPVRGHCHFLFQVKAHFCYESRI